MSDQTSEPNGIARELERSNSENAKLRHGLVEVRKFLKRPEWGTIDYMDGTEVYDDIDQAIFLIDQALGEISDGQ